MNDNSDLDVLIVGAGPTGLMLANQLARRGVRFDIIDRHAGPSRETRALGVHARTLEIYARLGVIERALEWGKPGTGANMWADGRKTARVPLGDAGQDLTPYPYILVLGQDDNERILGDRLREFGHAVQWNCELTGFEQQPDRVIATLGQPDGSTRSVSAAWVAGCDGARSAVREQSGIEFPGAPYEHVFFVADVQMTGTFVPDEVNVYLWQSGFHLLFPMRGQDHWRIVGIVPPELRREGVGFDDLLPSIQREVGSALDIRSCSWFSTYRIHHRAAARFRDRRCFLLGDAAHIHSPVGAQGMNTGLQDAYNLGWKLALVVKGQAGAALLDSYEAERIPVARRLLETTDRAFRLVVSDSRLAGLLRTRVLARVAALAMGRPDIQRFAFRTVSQIAIHYRDSTLSAQAPAGWPDEAPHPGDRFPWLRWSEEDGQTVDLFERLDDTRFTLLLFGQPAPAQGIEGFDDEANESGAGSRGGAEDRMEEGGFGDGKGADDEGSERSGDQGETPGAPGLQVHAFPDEPSGAMRKALARHAVPALSWFLLRPDGHVALCGTHLDADAIARWAAQHLHLRSVVRSGLNSAHPNRAAAAVIAALTMT